MKTNVHRAHATLPELLGGYTPGPGAYDEMMDANGAVRSHWEPVLDALAAFDSRERTVRAARMNRRVRETGIAHDMFADPSKSDQPWHVDLVPMLIGASEWHWLQQALVQRARLMNAILMDVYGEQRLLSSGMIPPGLVFSDPSFLRACRDILPQQGFLQFFATDLARAADGQWRVIDSHTETPAGIGLVLANRLVHTHIAGEVFAASNAQRLAPYFRDMQAALTQRCGRADPRIALLTPGSQHEDYFSHAYLARYLGLILVEGGDLRVAGDQVMLKTLEGLQQIDLIVRCTDGAKSDPLALDPAGFLGPAGLTQACRFKPERVVNALGSALVENRGLGRYLPRLSEEMLGEPLMLPDAPRWWLGDAAANDYAVQNIDQLVIRPAHEATGRPGRASLGRVSNELSDRQRTDLIGEIQLNGAMWVAEEKIGFGTSPVWTNEGLRPRPFAMRMFATMTRDGYRVMPGGIAMTVDPGMAVGLNAPDGETRDVWVLSDAPEPQHVSLWRPTVETAHVQRAQRVLQSRVADDLYWLGRYAERADWTMRVVRSAVNRQQEDAGQDDSQRAATVCLYTLLAKDPKAAQLLTRQPTLNSAANLSHLLVSPAGGNHCLPHICDGLHHVAGLTRDRLSLEAWRTLNALGPQSSWRARLSNASPGEMLDLLDEGLLAIAAFNGLMHENMTRNSGWSFLDMGRRLERGLNICETIVPLFEKATGADDEMHSLMFLLEVADSFITYRSRYRLDPMLPLVLDLLLVDETNPRSLAFQLSSLSTHLSGLPHTASGVNLPEEQRILVSLISVIKLVDVRALAASNDRQQRPHLVAAMREQSEKLPELSTAIMRHFFNLKDEKPHRVHTRA